MLLEDNLQQRIQNPDMYRDYRSNAQLLIQVFQDLGLDNM